MEEGGPAGPDEGEGVPEGGISDPFAQLLDPGFESNALIREPSAEERARTAGTEDERAEDLKRRLVAAAEHDRRVADQESKRLKHQRRAERRSSMRKWAPAMLALALICAGGWYVTKHDEPTTTTVAASSKNTTSTVPDHPPAPKKESAKPLGTPPPLPVVPGQFEFLHKQTGSDRPVAYNPCRPLRYVYNPAGAPPGASDLIRQALARTAAATGLKFESAGFTDEAWTKDRPQYLPKLYGKRWAPVLIAWATDQQVPDLGGYVAGLGGSGARNIDGGPSVYVSGSLVLDAADLSQTMSEPGGPDVVRGIIQHELGHVVGLDHVADPHQLMYAEGSPAQTNDWGNGDLAGLHALGSGDCVPGL